MDDNGRWSHKMGEARVTDEDDSKPARKINDPRNAFIEKRRGVEYEFVSFMTTNRRTVNIGGNKPPHCP